MISITSMGGQWPIILWLIPKGNCLESILGWRLEDITHRKHTQQQIERLNTDLAGQIEGHRLAIRQLQAATAELEQKNVELEQFHDIVVGRALKMIDLETELRKLQRHPTVTDIERGSLPHTGTNSFEWNFSRTSLPPGLPARGARQVKDKDETMV
jgi:hypothetical protein